MARDNSGYVAEVEALLEIEGIATPLQIRRMKLIVELGSAQAAAIADGVAPRVVQIAVTSVKRKAIARGYSPEHGHNHSTPPGYIYKGTSTLYDADGKIKLQWVKTQKDREAQAELLAQSLECILEPLRARSERPKKPSRTLADHLTVYPVPDVHFGLLAHAEEADEDFDIAIAEAMLADAVDDLVSRSIKSEKALIAFLGDFFHADNLSNKTRRKGHTLYTAAKWPLVARAGVKVARYIVDQAVKRHGQVHVEVLVGNHDDHTSFMLALALSSFYEKNRRVTVSLEISPYRYYRFGKVLIGMAHGHLAKVEKMAGMMAADRAEDWGETLHRHWLTGHYHSRTVEELQGCTQEGFRSPSPQSGHEFSMGYRSSRDLQAILFHDELGEVGRNRIATSSLLMKKRKSLDDA